MAYGLSIKNDNDDFVISEDSPALVVLEEISVTASGWSNGSTLYREQKINFSNSYDNRPLIAMRPTSGGLVVRPFVHSSGNKFNAVTVVAPSGSPTFDILVLGSADNYNGTIPTNSEKYGLIVKDTDGDTVFDSRWRNVPTLVDAATVGTSLSTPTPDLIAPSFSGHTPGDGPVRDLPFDVTNAFYCIDTVVGQTYTTTGDILNGFLTYLHLPSVQEIDDGSYSFELTTVDNPNAIGLSSVFRGRILTFRYEHFGD